MLKNLAPKSRSFLRTFNDNDKARLKLILIPHPCAISIAADPSGTTIMPKNKHIHLHTTANRVIRMLDTHHTAEAY